MLGCSVNTIRDHAAKLGLTLADKSTYYKDKLTETNRQAAFKAGKRPPYHISRRKHTDEDKRRIGEKRKALYAAERRRAMYGLPQHTKIKVKY